MPGMKAVGTKTDERTRAIAMTGLESSAMAFLAASLGARPSSMWRCTPSTTTTASSTTKPMASTNPNIESVLMEKPNSGKKTNVPTSETGSASGVRTGQLVRRHNGARFPVQPAEIAVVLSAQLHARYILDAHDPAIRRFAQNDLPKFLWRSQAALGADRVGVFLVFGRWLAANLPGGIHGVLRLNGVDHISNCDSQFCQLVGLHPQAHRILAGAEDLDIANTGRTCDGVMEIDVGIVGQKLCIVGAVRRIQAD